MLLLQQMAQYDNVFVWAIYTKALILLYKVPRLSNSVYLQWVSPRPNVPSGVL